MKTFAKPRNYVDKLLDISDYGLRRHWTAGGPADLPAGSVKFNPFIWIPLFPTLDHSVCQLLWAIESATARRQDLPTRRAVAVEAKSLGFRARLAEHPNYWRDLFRFGYVRQYRRTYGKGSGRHFDVVYELTFKAKDMLERARQNMNANLPPIESIDPGFESKTTIWAKQRGQWKCPFAMVPPLSGFKN